MNEIKTVSKQFRHKIETFFWKKERKKENVWKPLRGVDHDIHCGIVVLIVNSEKKRDCGQIH